jgi:membrane fusion protein (multidrug efflux system)
MAAAIAAIAALAISCHGGRKAGPAAKEIQATTVSRGAIERSVLFTGNIEAEDAIELHPRAPGKISKKLLKEGDPVKRGQTVLLVDRDEIGFTFRPMPVESPIDGLVGTIAVDVGAQVKPDDAIATVVRSGDMRVKLDVPERYLPTIVPGAAVSMAVDALGGESYAGTIATASPVVDQKTRTARVEIAVPNADGKLRHGMFGRLKLVVERRDGVLSVPNNAISWEGEKQVVYRVEEGKVFRRVVTVGLRSDTHVEIASGLAEGDVVAVGDLLDLKEGEAVAVKKKDKT